MTKHQLILLENPIIVSDEEITLTHTLKECWYYFDGKISKREYSHDVEAKLIIAGIPELPKIDYNGFEEKLGIVDIWKLACGEKITKNVFNDRKAFIKGFKAAQKLNEKKFSLEDVEFIYRLGYEDRDNDIGYGSNLPYIKEKLLEPKVFDIELEMEEYIEERTGTELNWTNKRIKIVNNSIKIINVL